jgi:hypothetical protein
MEIKEINVLGSGVHFRFVCGSCKKYVDNGDKFCRNCGKELEHLPHNVSVADVASILTAVFKKKPLLPNDSVVSVAPDNDDAGKVEDNQKPSSEFDALRQCCPRCKSTREGCEFLQGNGECHGIVYPTYPPQYPKCVFDKKREELT